jgi:hypothetical protein
MQDSLDRLLLELVSVSDATTTKRVRGITRGGETKRISDSRHDGAEVCSARRGRAVHGEDEIIRLAAGNEMCQQCADTWNEQLSSLVAPSLGAIQAKAGASYGRK